MQWPIAVPFPELITIGSKRSDFTWTVNLKEEIFKHFRFQSKIVWRNAIGFLALHITALFGSYLGLRNILHLEFATILWSIFIAVVAGQGITMGAHRYWTHRTFKAKYPLQVILIILQTIASQNCLYIWVRDHRLHHKHSDTNADPHNASRGFFFSHMGWLMMKKHPDVIKMGKTIDMSDLEADSLVMFQKKLYKTMYTIFALIIPVAVPVYLWNEDLVSAFFINLARIVITLNLTWCVNSVAHIYGNKPFDKNILPVESTFTSWVALGEGWHNYHHAFPWDYKAAELGSGVNLTRYFIEQLAKIGWIYDLRVATPALVAAKAKRSGDGTFGQMENDTSNYGQTILSDT